jgi:hypothetical protein
MAFMNGGGALAAKNTYLALGPRHVDLVWAGPMLIAVGGFTGVYALFGRTWHVALPEGRSPLTAEELRYLNTPAAKQSIRAAFAAKKL